MLNSARAAIAKLDSRQNGDPNDALLPGEQRVLSSYKPRLEAGLYTVRVRQDIKVDDEHKLDTKQSFQQFKVIAPQYVLPENLIYSKYPEEGFGAARTTLPHVTLNDAHFPWDRAPSPSYHADDGQKSVTPWLALLAFAPDELAVDKEDLDGGALDAIVPADVKRPLKQSPTKSINLPISALKKMQNASRLASPIVHTEFVEDEANASSDLIFVQPRLFNELFKSYDKNGQAMAQTNADPARYKFLTHVRKVCLDGSAVPSEPGQPGLFSLLVSHRTGPLDAPSPTPVVVHLMSIEGVPDMSWPVPESIKYVAMASLYSWTYMCLPGGNIVDEMRQIGDGLGMLRAPDSVLAKLDNAAAPEIARMRARLQDGYTLTRYRTQTGEVSAAVFRGPLVPTMVPSPLSSVLARQSNSGADLQIFDPKIGMIDITYSAAWQLGKTLALADQGFCVALSRLRTIVERIALDKAKVSAIAPLRIHKTKGQLLSSLLDTTRRIVDLPHNQRAHPENLDVKHRWQSTAPGAAVIDVSLNNSDVQDGFAVHAETTVTMMAQSAVGQGKDEHEDEEVYNEFNKPYSSDWMTILSSVLDKMFLHNIPAHYLIVDPSYLPPESLRFFHIDANWVDALLDGALSIGNHLDSPFDHIRARIKIAVNRYMKTEIPRLKRVPQIPTFGFFLRSDLVRQLPDMLLNVAFDAPLKADLAAASRAPILRQEIIDTGIMLCLLDRTPIDKINGRLNSITFTQPPHQQSFIVGESLDLATLKIGYKYISTDLGFKRGEHDIRAPETWAKNPSDSPNKIPVFVWGEANDVRTLILPSLADNVYQTLQKGMPENTFNETEATSAMLAIHLNSPNYVLKLGSSTVPGQPSEYEPEQFTDRTLKMLGGDDARTGIVAMRKPATEFQLTSQFSSFNRQLDASQTLLPPEQRAGSNASRLLSQPPHWPLLPVAGRDRHRHQPAEWKADQTVNPNSPAGPPIFRYDVYTVKQLRDLQKGNAVQSSSAVKPAYIRQVFMSTGQKEDIVFSIQLEGDPHFVGNYRLQEIKLIIRLGPVKGFPNDPTFLLERYDGSGTTMLSNMRFNAVAELTEDHELHLRVIPRTSDPDGVYCSGVREASFILNLVRINNYPANRVVYIRRLIKFAGWQWFEGQELRVEMTRYVPPEMARPIGPSRR